MDPAVKNALDLRLAKGEITTEEYEDIRNRLQESESPKESVARPEQNSPQEQGVTIHRNLEIRGDLIIHLGEKIDLREIKVLRFTMSRIVINAIPQTHTNLIIVLKDGRKISTKGLAVFKEGKKNRAIALGYQMLAHKTFQQRLMKVVEEINANGFLTIPNTEVKVYPNGDITEGSTQLNLHEANQEGNLLIGTVDRDFLSRSSSAPDQVIIGRGGTSMIRTRIAFTLNDNKDIYHALLRKICSDPQKGR